MLGIEVSQRPWEHFPTALGILPKGVGKPYVVPSYAKLLTTINYEVKEDNV